MALKVVHYIIPDKCHLTVILYFYYYVRLFVIRNIILGIHKII